MGAGGAGSVGGPETVAALKQMTGKLSSTTGPLADLQERAFTYRLFGRVLQLIGGALRAKLLG